MKRLLYVLIPSVATLFLASCDPIYYKPNAVNTPMFTDKGQTHVSLGGSVGTNYNQNSYFFDAQAAYSPIKHLGVMVNYSSNSFYNEEADPGVYRTKSNLIEAGIGGYYADGGKVKIVNELYGGAGVGSLNGDISMDYSRIFLQYGIGMRSPWVDLIFNFRVCNLNTYHFNANGHDSLYLIDSKLIDNNNNRIDSKPAFFAEPAFTLRTGYRFIKVQMQLVFSNSDVKWPYSESRYTVGAYFSMEDLLDFIKENNKPTKK